MSFAGELVLGIFSYIMGSATFPDEWRAEPFIAHEKEHEIQAIKQRLRQYKKRYAKHVQKHQYNQRNSLETNLRTLRAIENNRKWIEHYQKELNDLHGTSG